MARKHRKIPKYLRQVEANEPVEKVQKTPRRILADRSQQAPNNSYGPPAYYEDLKFRCVDCGKREVWTAEQQQWWYEVAKGPIYATATRCRNCRQKRRLAKEEQRCRSEAGHKLKESTHSKFTDC